MKKTFSISMLLAIVFILVDIAFAVDPVPDIKATYSMGTNHSAHTAILLPNGKTFVAGGFDINRLNSAELYNYCEEATFHSTTGILHIPTVVVNGNDRYEVEMEYYGNYFGSMFFRLNSAIPK